MGNNDSPLLADLTLSAMEFRFLNSSIHYQEACLLNLTTQYIDDLFNCNCPNFLDHCKNIYHSSLVLENTTGSGDSSNYLDLTIVNDGQQHFVKLFNKADSFNFTGQRFSHVDSNVHSNLGYNTFYVQMVRIARLSTRAIDFKEKLVEIYNAFCNKGFNRFELQ
ncbi:MAG: hypothetical protein GY861_11120, partial [bacterium]|nr:hypothetical protein [bacterium]